jgi:predicted adenine nucleotide alpha hydrolase (AANH) superfamily ATPase/ribonuclease HII
MLKNKKKIYIGIDEAGRGPLAGPVVACAFAFDHSLHSYDSFETSSLAQVFSQLQDSKQLSAKKRELLFKELINLSNTSASSLDPSDVSVEFLDIKNGFLCSFGVGVVDNHIIDQINIRQANKLAMQRALDELFLKIKQKDIHSILIDGNDNYSFENVKKKPIYIIKGDTKILEIKAASIIAKHFRDTLMQSYAQLYPSLYFHTHKGYGTKKHKEALRNTSQITGIHRLSYKPVQDVILKKPRLLLHVCCGPDASIPIMDLKNTYEIIAFWYDPNIQPKKEYDKRFAAFKKICKLESIQFYEGEYDTARFFQIIQGLEKTKEQGAKCFKCYEMRLIRSIEAAQEYHCEYFTTSLLMSPHKTEQKLFQQGYALEKQYNIRFLDISFRKNNGFNRSVVYTKKHSIFRQNYCGCIYSDTYPKL